MSDPVSGESRLKDWPLSAYVLIAANLIPLVGVVFFGWSTFAILMLFWAENVVIGVLNLARMAIAGWAGAGFLGLIGALFTMAFFTVHYGIFTLGHGVFITAIFDPEAPPDGSGASGDLTELAAQVVPPFIEQNLLLGVFALAASHLISLFVNFIGAGEFRRTNVQTLMAAPYGRVIVLHVVILIGGGVSQALGSPLWALLMLVALKIAIDLAAHLNEHERLQSTGEAAAVDIGVRDAIARAKAARARRGRGPFR